MLTTGVIKEIVTSDTDNLPVNPVLQILGLKKIQGTKGQERYRVILSDGENYYTSGMIGTQLNELVQDQIIDAKTIIQLVRYTCNVVQGTRKVIVVLDVKVVKPADEVSGKIGEPDQLSDQISVLSEMAKEANGSDGMQQKPAMQNTTNMAAKPAFGGQQPNKGFGNAAMPRPNPYGAKGGAFYGGGSKMQNQPNAGPGGVMVHPISSLTPYQNRWTVRARVTNKSQIRTWSNSRGEGKLFSIDLLDESGEIKATGFNDAVDKFYEILETGKVYYITKGSLKTANKQYTSLKNDYEMYLNSDTIIDECVEKVDLPQVKFNFVNIGDLENVNKDAVVDIIGVVKAMQDVFQITTKTTNRQVSKRDLTLVDRSETSVNVTLWGEQAEKFEENAGDNSIVAIKGAKVSDFGGRSLSVLNSSVFHVNPDIPEAHALRGWYDGHGKVAGIKSISGQRIDGGMPAEFKSIEQIKTENIGMGDKPDYFSITANLGFFRKDRCLYKACPTDGCNKKVIDEGGEYRCEKCNRSFPDFKYRLMLSANICDCTGNQWMTCFQDCAEILLGNTTENIGRMREEDEQAFEDVFHEANFKAFTMKMRAKVETYHDESRLKVVCINASPIDYLAESTRLLEQIKKLEAL